MSEENRAIALKYDGIDAPRVTAKGEEALAREIIRLAEAHGVPLYQDADLVRLLSHLELNDTIPRDLYIVVAKIIAFAYILTGKSNGREA